MKAKKLSISILLILIITILTLNSIFSLTVTSGEIGIELINPFGISVSPETKSLKTSSATDYTVKVNLPLFASKKEYGVSLNSDVGTKNKNLACGLGGDYITKLKSNSANGGKFNKTIKAYHCKTTNELIDSIKVPSSWGNDDLILYCNDGKKIRALIKNYDFLTSKMNAYKLCILKNVDKGLTMVAGLDIGNTTIGEKQGFSPETGYETYYYNSDSEEGSIIEINKYEFKSGSSPMIFEDLKDGLTYYFDYDDTNKYFILRNFNDNLNTKLNTIFSKNIDLSRIALFKKTGGSKIYGYEEIIKKTLGSGTVLKPMYIISGNIVGLTSQICTNSLQKFRAKKNVNMNINRLVTCKNNEIRINSDTIDGNKYGNPRDMSIDSFNLFKNIILGLN